eukprot:2416259-Pyramimonas_sp.AAC.1
MLPAHHVGRDEEDRGAQARVELRGSRPMGRQHTAPVGLLHTGRRHRREGRHSSRAARGSWARVLS